MCFPLAIPPATIYTHNKSLEDIETQIACLHAL